MINDRAQSVILLCIAILCTALIAGCDFGEGPKEVNWTRYKRMFITSEGRVIDTGNKNISHSEGQGWGMFFAVQHHDRRTFDKLWAWTQKNLQVRKIDKLVSWKWDPSLVENHTPDINNATDGDIFIAWSLIQAYELWGESEYYETALRLMKDIRDHLIHNYANYTIILPGKVGFIRNDHLLINLSYWVYPAFEAFIKYDPDKKWQALIDSGLRLSKNARFGRWNLPPDWLTLRPDGRVEVAKDYPPLFGYDAIRLPLYLFWAGFQNHDLFEPYEVFLLDSFQTGRIPAWVNLSDEQIAPYNASLGALTILRLVSAKNKSHFIKKLSTDLKPDLDYYAASLLMLIKQAIRNQM